MTDDAEENASRILNLVHDSDAVISLLGIAGDKDRARLFDFAVATGVASLPPGSDAITALGGVYWHLARSEFEHADLVADSISRMRREISPHRVGCPMLPALDFLLGVGARDPVGQTPMLIAIDAALQPPVSGRPKLNQQTRIDYAVAIGVAALPPNSDIAWVLEDTVSRLNAEDLPHDEMVAYAMDRLLRDEDHGFEPHPAIPALNFLHQPFYPQPFQSAQAEPQSENLRQLLATGKVVQLTPRPRY